MLENNDHKQRIEYSYFSMKHTLNTYIGIYFMSRWLVTHKQQTVISGWSSSTDESKCNSINRLIYLQHLCLFRFSLIKTDVRNGFACRWLDRFHSRTAPQQSIKMFVFSSLRFWEVLFRLQQTVRTRTVMSVKFPCSPFQMASAIFGTLYIYSCIIFEDVAIFIPIERNHWASIILIDS